MARLFEFYDLCYTTEKEEQGFNIEQFLTIDYVENRLGFPLTHGDCVLTEEYRATGLHIVYDVPNEPKRFFYECMDSAGHGEVPIEISRHIENPIAFFKNLETYGLRSFGGAKGDICIIHLDPLANPIVNETAGGRVVHPNRKPYYDVGEESIYIYDPSKSLNREWEYRPLSEKTPSQFLGEEDYFGDDDEEYDECCLQRNKKRKIWVDELKVGDYVTQSVTKGGGAGLFGGSNIAYIPPNRERIYTFNKYADIHPPQTPFEEFEKEDQEHIMDYLKENNFLNENGKLDRRARLCCFTKHTVEQKDLWVSQSSLKNIVDGKIVERIVSIS